VTAILLQPWPVPVKTREHWPEVTSLINTSLSSQITPPFFLIRSSKSPYLQAATLPYFAYFTVLITRKRGDSSFAKITKGAALSPRLHVNIAFTITRSRAITR
jgi:hypothetical protein